MILEKGNMWDAFDPDNIFMITTNPIRRKDGGVVMGRGIALEAKSKYPQLPYDFGKNLDRINTRIDQQFIGHIGKYDEVDVWWFMVKDHWANKADLGIIGSSCYYLSNMAKNTSTRIDLNFPGIGNGGLPRDSVLYLLEDLPDNIHIWEYA